MKNIAKLCTYAGLILIVLSIVTRLPGGGALFTYFSPRGVLEFSQAILLLAIALSVTSCEKK